MAKATTQAGEPTIRDLGEEAKDLLDQAADKIDAMVAQSEAETPEPPDPGGGGGGGTDPSPGTGVPSGPDDPRFANVRPRSRIDVTSGHFEDFEIRDDSGSPLLGHKNFTAKRFRLYGREGIRIGGPSIVCEDFWMEIAGQGDDHGDGIQGYTGPPTNNSPSPGIVFRRGKLIMTSGANNCGLFLADNCRTSMICEDFEIEDRGGCPHGAAWFPNRPDDTGIFEIGYRRVNLIGQKYGNGGIDVSGSGAHRPEILFWENVTANGKPVPRPW